MGMEMEGRGWGWRGKEGAVLLVGGSVAIGLGCCAVGPGRWV